MNRRISVVVTLVASAAILALPAAAHAGCLAQWNASSRLIYTTPPPVMTTHGSQGGAQCGSINGNTYHIDWYAQEYEPSTGTWDQIGLLFGGSNSFTNNVANKYYPYSNSPEGVPCWAYSNSSTLARLKMIVKNDTAGSTSISYSQGTSLPASCF